MCVCVWNCTFECAWMPFITALCASCRRLFHGFKEAASCTRGFLSYLIKRDERKKSTRHMGLRFKGDLMHVPIWVFVNKKIKNNQIRSWRRNTRSFHLNVYDGVSLRGIFGNAYSFSLVKSLTYTLIRQEEDKQIRYEVF